MKAKEDGIATFRESSFTGSTSKQFGLLLPIGIITNDILMSLYSIVFNNIEMYPCLSLRQYEIILNPTLS